MTKLIHKNETRGFADHGWLKSHHTFSFGSYQDPERMGFGLLRVINDDSVEPSKGFATHPHKNMEIVSILLSGSLRHKDSQGNEGVIQSGEVQLMSAGIGVTHSEYNDSNTEPVHFLQIWVLPKEKNIEPRYDQRSFEKNDRKDQFQTVVNPIGANLGGVEMNQDAYFSLIDMSEGVELSYETKRPGSGVYIFVCEGQVTVEGDHLDRRDAIGVSGCEGIKLTANQSNQLLVIEVPM